MSSSKTLEWTQVAVHAALQNYNALDERAQHVAAIVYRVRFPRDAAQTYFEISWPEYVGPEPHGMFSAGYYYRSNSHGMDIPIGYLWEPDDDVIRQRETERIEAERLHAQRQRELQQAAEEAEREQIERKTYERLKAKYDKGS